MDYGIWRDVTISKYGYFENDYYRMFSYWRDLCVGLSLSETAFEADVCGYFQNVQAAGRQRLRVTYGSLYQTMHRKIGFYGCGSELCCVMVLVKSFNHR